MLGPSLQGNQARQSMDTLTPIDLQQLASVPWREVNAHVSHAEGLYFFINEA